MNYKQVSASGYGCLQRNKKYFIIFLYFSVHKFFEISPSFFNPYVIIILLELGTSSFPLIDFSTKVK